MNRSPSCGQTASNCPCAILAPAIERISRNPLADWLTTSTHPDAPPACLAGFAASLSDRPSAGTRTGYRNPCREYMRTFSGCENSFPEMKNAWLQSLRRPSRFRMPPAGGICAWQTGLRPGTRQMIEQAPAMTDRAILAETNLRRRQLLCQLLPNLCQHHCKSEVSSLRSWLVLRLSEIDFSPVSCIRSTAKGGNASRFRAMDADEWRPLRRPAPNNALIPY